MTTPISHAAVATRTHIHSSPPHDEDAELSLGIGSRPHSVWICSLATLNSATSWDRCADRDLVHPWRTRNTHRRRKGLGPPEGFWHKSDHSWNSAVLFQLVPGWAQHTPIHRHALTHKPGARSPAELHWSLFIFSVWVLSYRTTHACSHCNTPGLPCKTMRCGIFVFVALLIGQVQGTPIKEMLL